MGSTTSTRTSSPPSPPRTVDICEILLKPPKERNLIFEFFPGHLNIWQAIFDNLESRDLVSFVRTSKTSREKILDYVEHYVLSHGRLENLRTILEECPLLLNEKALKLKFESLEKDPNFRPTLIYLKAVKWLCDKDMIIRRPVYKANHFPHLGNESYIVQTFDQSLNRDVVELKSVCWLQFVMDFEDIEAGNYEVAVRIKLKDEFRWPNWNENREYFTTFLVKEEKEIQVGKNKSKMVENELQKTEVLGTTWEKIGKRDKNVSDLLPNASIKFDNFGSGSNYFWLILDPFELKGKNKITVEFKDVNNPYWKSGMFWDFVQIRKL